MTTPEGLALPAEARVAIGVGESPDEEAAPDLEMF